MCTTVDNKTIVLPTTTRTITEFISHTMMSITTKDMVLDIITQSMTTTLTTAITQQSITQSTTECHQHTTMVMDTTQLCSDTFTEQTLR